MKSRNIESILHKTLKPALGCTEPMAISLGVAAAVMATEGWSPQNPHIPMKALAVEDVQSVRVAMNKGVFKNAFSIYIPSHHCKGWEIQSPVGVNYKDRCRKEGWMAKPKVFVTRVILDQGMNLISGFCDADVWPGELPPTRKVILQRARGVDGLLCLLTDKIDAEIMDAIGPQLKVISNHAVGFDNIAVSDATARGIPVGNTPGILTDATADMAFALLMAAGRRIVEGDRTVRDGGWKTWSPSFMLGADFVGATLGLVGFGRIGRAVARRAAGFGMRILYYDPHPAPPETGVAAEPAELDALLREADFVSIHTPLNDETRHLVDAAFLAKMKPMAILVNTARGQIVDQKALYDALKSRHIFAAGLDVTDPEPLPIDSPLLDLNNLVVCPHIASASWATRAMMSRMAAANLIAGLKGERLPNCVNPEVYSAMPQNVIMANLEVTKKCARKTSMRGTCQLRKLAKA